MTAWVEGNRAFFLGTQAHLIDNSREIAEHAWFADRVSHNPAVRWIVGRFVEAGTVNSNNHLFNLEGLQMGRPSIEHAPLNINHTPRRIVGAFVDAELIYPTTTAGTPVGDQQQQREDARDFSREKRKQLAQEGKALPDGSFPIVTVGDLRNAIQALGRASDKDKARRHIIKRARALRKTDMLPDDWNVKAADDTDSLITDPNTTGYVTLTQPSLQDAVLDWTDTQPGIVTAASTSGEPPTPLPNPHIEALSVVWRYYFPEEFAEIELAHAEGRLFYSMECVPESVKCTGDEGCGEVFGYRGRQSETYCEHLNESASIKELIRPHFTGGAAVIPPHAPAWSDADVYALVARHSELAESLYEQLSEELPHLSPAEWEAQMASILAKAQ